MTAATSLPSPRPPGNCGCASDEVAPRVEQYRVTVPRPTADAGPVRALQSAAQVAASFVVPGSVAGRVTVTGDDGSVLVSLAIPAEVPAIPPPQEPPASSDWQFTERSATHNGHPVKVSRSRLKLLRVLAEAEGPVPAKELARLAFDRQTDEENVRYHVRALRAELAVAFPAWCEPTVASSREGYLLARF